MNRPLTNLEKLSTSLLYVLGVTLLIYAFLSFKSSAITVIFVLIAFTLQRIATNYKSPFSMKLRVTDYLFSLMIFSNLFIAGNLVAFIVPSLSYLAYLFLIAPELYRKEASESVEKALQSKKPEDAQTALLQLKTIYAFRSDNDKHQQLLSICSKEVTN